MIKIIKFESHPFDGATLTYEDDGLRMTITGNRAVKKYKEIKIQEYGSYEKLPDDLKFSFLFI